MKTWQKLYFWCVVVAALTGLFYLASDPDEPLSADGRTPLTLLTDAGPVQTTMADYLPLAVAAEMPVSFGPEALKAQAVAARTFALACQKHADADVCTNSGCCMAYLDEPALRERWGGSFGENMQAVRAAVAATDGEYLTYEGTPIQAAFHAGSIGCTEDSGAIWSALPYLVSVESPETAENAPTLMSDAAFSPAGLAATLGLETDDDPASWLGPVVPDGAGRVRTITIGGKRFTGSTVRALLGLRSTAFTAAWDGTAFRFTVAGSGHGVGMSQTGAMLYAAQGMLYRDILAHYYPGTELVTLPVQPSGSPSK